MSDIDVLILVPLIPVAPVLVTPWLPWEKWIPWGKIPKAVAGPYLLYAAFAAWHFKFDPWIVAIVGLWGVVVSILAVIDKFRKPVPPIIANDQQGQQANGR